MNTKNNIKDSELGELLPFVPRRRDDWGGWAYDHRYGITISVLVYFTLTFLFLSVRIPVMHLDTGAILIEMETNAAELQQLAESERMLREQLSGIDLSGVDNLASNDATMNETALANESMGRQAAEMTAEARAMAERLSSSREAYEQGLAAAEQIRNSASGERGLNDPQTNNSVRRAGNVTVRYTLENRFHTYLHTPAYQCEGGGEVVVDILVNRSGRVVAASASKNTASAGCLVDMAVKAALLSQFNADTGAAERQQGTITYIFIPQ